MKKILLIAAVLPWAFTCANAEEIKCYVSSYSYTLTVKDDLGEVIHSETESWPEDLTTTKIKTGFQYEYMDDPGEYVGNIYQYFNAVAKYDLSPLAGISASQITSAKLVGVQLVSHDVDSVSASPTFNHVLGGNPEEICGIEEIGTEIDLVSYIASDVNAGNDTAQFLFKAPDVPVGTTGENLAKVGMLINQSSETPSYLLITYASVPEPSACAAVFGALAIAFAIKRRPRK